MSIVRVLPQNRMIVCVLTPREASLIQGQLLDPAEFPWQDTEAQVTAAGFRAQLYEAVAGTAAAELDATIGVLLTPRREEPEGEEVMQEEKPEEAVEPPPMMEARKELSGVPRRVPKRRRSLLGALRELLKTEVRNPERLASE